MRRINKKIFLIAALVLSLVVLSFASMGFASDAAGEGQLIEKNERANVSEQLQESKQLRLEEGEGPCSEDCEPQQKRLQENKELQEKKELMEQKQNRLNKEMNQGGRNQASVSHNVI